ncbi:winged helix-turn-helix transcriptional regulator [Pseudovibrio brasiliensis]|uniref:Winged helix-turn-helix transcriptional regulator n=1 Tax=Pseudovibrio brasiliensis TaxID=1898042 RepID=A0ABX8AM26_9HYPH|nr:winged helix-turn-helix transcriptional regulator [Pseudovibrio brasiliensis]QUS56120.1 winged helix-turn-helix transcriptional regulator [Pseudovibrio brasiliensis]
MDIATLVKLTSRAWSLNILAHLHAGVPGRQAPLLAASGASRTSFAASLEHLVELKLLERNPGHGHPLRPEFRLTPKGVRAAEIASRIVSAVPNDTEFSLLRKSWTVPILALTATPQRFSSIRTDLATITDRALSASLVRLEEREWIRRDINTTQRVPFPTYCAANTGIQINRAIDLRV